MIVMDENFPASQADRLRSWEPSMRQIGVDVGRKGMDDDELIPLLIGLSRPTFVTRDRDFFLQSLCHSQHCLVILAIDEDQSAIYVRRLLKHKAFNANAKRLGTVLKLSHIAIHCWRLKSQQEEHVPWTKP